MSDESLDGEDDEIQLGSYKLEYVSLKDSKETESDISSDSSASRKQLKSPHTLLKHAPSGSPKGNERTLLQKDQAEHYKRRLQEAEQSLSSRDGLLAILQEQLQKIQNLYKQSLDDAQDLRHKYCVTVQDLNNLRVICEKYKEDVEILTKKEKSGNSNKKELQKLQNEVDNWKAQYKDLLKQVKVLEKEVAATADKISEEIQVDLLENRDLQPDINILKDHCVSIQNCLKEQNRKMDLLVRQQQEDAQQPDCVKRKLEPILENELLSITKEPVKLKNDFKSNNCVGENDSEKSMQSTTSSLKDEMEIMKLELEKLDKKNSQLQSDIHGIDKLKDELKKLNVQSSTEPTGSPVIIKDSLVENLKKENEHLRGQLELLKTKPSLYFAEDQNLPNDGSTCSDDANNYAQLVRSRQASRVSFAVTAGCLQAELAELQQENSELKLKIKKQQDGDTNTDDKERLTVELVNLRRQLKQKQEDVDHFQDELETIASKKNSIIRQFQTANELLRSDYKELLEINSKLTRDLKTKTAGMYESTKTSDHPAYKGSITLVRDNIEYKEVDDKPNLQLNSKIEESDTINTNDIRKSTTDIINEAVITANHKIQDELKEKKKELEIITGEFKTKTADLTEKERIIKRQLSEIGKLRKTINDSNTILQETEKTKTELESKRKEIIENGTKIQDLQSTINVLKSKLSRAMHENEQKNKDLQEHIACTCKMKNLEAELSTVKDLTKNFTKENETLNAQISMMKNTLQQYREEAEFKKLENEKLRIKEEQLQSAVSSARRNSENLAWEFQREVEKNKISLSEMSKGCNSIEKECETKIKKVNEANQELKNILQQKEDEIKKLTDKINVVTEELEATKSEYQKHLNTYDRSISEIKFLFLNKENELMSTIHDLQSHEDKLQLIEEENENLRECLQKNSEAGLHLQEATKTLEENYANEKMKNAELNNFLNNIREEVRTLKIQLQDLLNNLECKLNVLKKEFLDNKRDISVSKKSVNEMLDCIEKFNSVVNQQPTTSTEETENYSYYYDKASEDCADKFTCTKDYCKKANSTCITNSCKLLPGCLFTMTMEERECLIKKLNDIEQKLNDPPIIKILPAKCMSPSSESILTSHAKNSDKDSYHTCPQISEATETDSEEQSEKNLQDSENIDTNRIKANTENDSRNESDGCLQCEMASHKSKTQKQCLVSENIDKNKTKDIVDADALRSGSHCSSACAQWKENLEEIREIISNLHRANNESATHSNKIEEHTEYQMGEESDGASECSQWEGNLEMISQTAKTLHSQKIGSSSQRQSAMGENVDKIEDSTEYQTADESDGASVCSQWEGNLEMISQIAKNLHNQKIDSTTPRQSTTVGKNSDTDKVKYTENQTADESDGASVCSQWEGNLEMISQIAKNLHNQKIDSTTPRQSTTVGKNNDIDKVKYTTDSQTADEISDGASVCSQWEGNLEMISQIAKNLHDQQTGPATQKQSAFDKNTENQASAGSPNGSKCSSTCEQWKKNFEMMYKLTSNLPRPKNKSATQGKGSTRPLGNKSLKDHNSNERRTTDLQLGVKDLPDPIAASSKEEDSPDPQSQQLKSQNLQEKPKVEVVYQNKSDNTTSESKEQKEEAKLKEKITGSFDCPGCPSQGPVSADEYLKTCNASGKENQNPADNTLKSPKPNRKCMPTAIPVLVQNSQKKAMAKCPAAASKKMTEIIDKTPKTKSNVSEQNNQDSLNSMKQKSIASRISTETKGTSRSSCACLKGIPCTPGTSATSSLPKNCICLGSNKTIEDINHDLNHEGKTVKSCECKPCTHKE